jgi:hypothetical protein
MTMKGLIVIALLLLQGCATWTQQDTAILMSALAAGVAGVAIGSAMTPQHRYSSLPSAYEANQNAALNYQLQQINNHLSEQAMYRYIQPTTVTPIHFGR